MHTLRLVFLILLFIFPLSASEKIRIFILHSYSQEYTWTKNQHNSFISTLNKRDTQFEFYTEYLDTKRLKLTPQYKKEFQRYLKFKYGEISLDAIYVTDDNALNFMLESYSNIYSKTSETPVFFSGVNNLKMDEILPKNLFRGVFEIKEIKQNIELIKQFSPQTRDIYIIGDSSSTYQSIKKEIKIQEKHFTNMNFHYISDEHISKVIEKLPDTKKSFVILTTIGNFKNDKNKTLLPNESIKKIREKNGLIILTMEDAYMAKGVIGGYVTSGEKQGEEAAKLVLEYLKDRSLKNINSLKISPNLYMFDFKELTQSRVLLSEYIYRISTIIHQDKDFLQKNKSIILEVLVIIFLFATFSFIPIYALLRKKFMKQLAYAKDIDGVRFKLYSKEQLLNHTLQDGNMAYWSMDVDTGKLYFSSELIDVLNINMDIYVDDKDILSYFIHSNDKKLFSDKLSEVKLLDEQIIFKHRMINSNNKLLNVEHFMYKEHLKYDEPAKIIGIIKFENQ